MDTESIVQNQDTEITEVCKTNNNVPKKIHSLNTTFQEQIGIPMNQPKTLNFFDFDETVIAEGFDRVVTTWQGMF